MATTRKTSKTTKSAGTGEPKRTRKGALAAAAAPRLREGTKRAGLIALLRRPEGMTLAQAVKATGWQPHTVRGAMAGALKKRLSLVIVSARPEDGGARVYRIA